MGPFIACRIFRDDRRVRFKNGGQLRTAAPFPENHLTMGKHTKRNNSTAETGLAIDMRAYPLPGEVFIRNDLIGQTEPPLS